MEPPSTTNRNWYVVLCHPGWEHRVKTGIELRALNLGHTDRIFRVAIPPRVNARPHPSEERFATVRPGPWGYVLVEMVLDERAWHVVRKVRGVIGYISDENNKPLPIP